MVGQLLRSCVCKEGRRIVRRPPAKKLLLQTAIFLFLFALAVLSALQLLLVPLPAEFLMCTVSVDFLLRQKLFCQLGSNFEICSSLFLLAPYLCHRLLTLTDLLNLTPPDLWMFNNGLYLLFTTFFCFVDVSAFDAIFFDRCQPGSA